MRITKTKIGDKEVFPFTIPSGIITTEAQTIENFANNFPEIGIISTKSIGPEPRAGNREPILGQYYPGCFVNAVGLTNIGAKRFAERLAEIDLPEDKFLLDSVFGKDGSEFVYCIETLDSHVDGFELNFSCPHAKGYGMQVGQDPEMVRGITKDSCRATKKPVFVKVTPNVANVAEIAEAAMEAGAYGITAINTVGPGYYSVDGHPVLTNKVGGISGRGILPVGLKCVREISQRLGKIPIIGMAGIATARDVEAYAEAGASFFGIGSGALAGMDDGEIGHYSSTLVKDLERGTNHAESLLKKVDMQYKKFRIRERKDLACDFKALTTDKSLYCRPGQFVFAWIPGVGEKPLSVMDNDPLTLGVLERGEFTRKINSLQAGDTVYVRGPYGKPIPDAGSATLVGGGCGIAGIYLAAKHLSKRGNVQMFLAAKDKDHIPYINEFRRCGKVLVATEDGSLGVKGMVTDLFEDAEFSRGAEYFFNCGPSAMVEAVLHVEMGMTSAQRIYSSMDYMTRCGVGICGSCADKKGKRTCVEGPYMRNV